jgi:hypothetical protein
MSLLQRNYENSNNSMNKITIFESSIIGLFIGVIVAAYLTFLTSVEGFISMPLSFLSWTPVLKMIPIPENYLLVASFVFCVAVFTLYGSLVGSLLKKNTKVGIFAVIILIAMGGWAIAAQYNAPLPLPPIPTTLVSATVINREPKTPKPYFGTEAFGDLDGDSKDDVAFLITRNDEDMPTMYYLSSALEIDGGHKGTNLIYLGEKMHPKSLVISGGVIAITYDEALRYAQVIGGKLVEVPAPAVATSTATTTPESSISIP